jgi:RNA polymerase sigma factor (sigma-70 family)
MQDDAIQVFTVQGSSPERFSQAVPPRVSFMAAIDTPFSLLVRLQGREKDDAWRECSVLHEPLIRRWVGRLISKPDSIDDVTQEVLKALVEGLPGFQHNRRKGAFRAWLRSIMIHRVRRYWRNRHPNVKQLSQARDLEDPRSKLSRLWDKEHGRHVVRSLLEKVRPEFDHETWDIFQRLVFGGSTPREIAADRGCSLNVVYMAKSQVLRRLRLEGEGLIE